MATVVVHHQLSAKPPARVPLCSPSPIPTTSYFSSNTKSSTRNPRRTSRHRNSSSLTIVAFSSSSRNGGSTPPETECPVPLDQQPINEYQSLATSFPFSWAAGDLPGYCIRLILTGGSFSLFVGLPVSWFGVVNPESEPLKCVFGAVSSGLFVVTLAVLRMYLGWAYVGNRLLSATVEYEETGWYDGQIWVKTAEVLARDRLLGSYSVKPVLSRLKFTLIGLAASLVLCFLVFNVESGQRNPYNPSEEAGGRAIAGVYNDESARSFEPDAFCGISLSWPCPHWSPTHIVN
ncbi:PREDICTED: uncharacterized protein LOC104600739 [Nelumbo nucifera]|uniref:Uncharacterized protein n=2 Tax=Nelumbo nucifera TaxID=4432 RepID=A0A822ZIH8_NELNU|nr:PREDICTED: uncharacterized protein LOC104600739 [Nelumbo nucifera]DAD44443.1 TPA_asm: hypothetical protein HUJ06_002673 [Nelumbo nucifera]